MIFNEIVDQFGHIIKDGWSKVSEDCYRHVRNSGGTQFYSRCVCCNDSCGKELLTFKGSLKNCNHLSFCSDQCKGIYKTRDQNILNHKTIIIFYYLIGMIATDGNVSKDTEKRAKNLIRISLQESDKQLLQGLQCIFKGSLKPVPKKNYNEKYGRKAKDQWCWSITSQPSKEFLGSIGITPAKSLTLDVDKWFQTLDYKQKLCFSLGVMDGDGCICNKKNNSSYVSLTSGSPQFIATMYKFFKEDILQNRYNIESNVNITGKKHKSFQFNTPESIKAILTELYSTLSYNKLFLQRKFDKFQEFLRIHNYV